jgi:hypothetical protein
MPIFNVYRIVSAYPMDVNYVFEIPTDKYVCINQGGKRNVSTITT